MSRRGAQWGQGTPQTAGDCVKANQNRKGPAGSGTLLSVTVARSRAGREGRPRTEELKEGETSAEEPVTTSPQPEGREVEGPKGTQNRATAKK